MADYEPIEALADQRFLNETIDEDQSDRLERTNVQTHEKLPTVFTGLEEWPLSTTLCCHECSMTFTTRPKFIPTFIREAAGGMGASRIEMGVRGNFCSWGCAELWIESRNVSSTEQRWRLQDNLRHAFHMFTGSHVSQIRAALPREELLQYGGELELATWLRRNRELEPSMESSAVLPAVAVASPAFAQWGNAWRSAAIELRPDNVGVTAMQPLTGAAVGAAVGSAVGSTPIATPIVAPTVAPTVGHLMSDDDFDKLLEELM